MDRRISGSNSWMNSCIAPATWNAVPTCHAPARSRSASRRRAPYPRRFDSFRRSSSRSPAPTQAVKSISRVTEKRRRPSDPVAVANKSCNGPYNRTRTCCYSRYISNTCS